MLILLLTFCFVGSNLAWGELGHILVARIAQKKLVDQGLDPDAFNWAQKILEITKTDSYETNWPFLESAGWADRFRNIDRSTSPWHFIAMPIISADFPDSSTPSTEQNITLKLTYMYAALNVKKQQISANLTEEGNALRFAIHLMGDIHQPLHDACKFSKKYPKGDAGANLVEVVFEGKSTNLHTVWDELFNKIPSAKSPLTETSQNLVSKQAQKLIENITIRPEREQSMMVDDYGSLETYEKIATESYQLAVDYAHDGVEDGDTLSDAYISRGFAVVQTRLVEAGLRLACFLSAAYRATLQPQQAKGL